ncbi:MAG: helix-turn-helix domain-containing protein [Oscillospiraceae bacterium]|jgi:transcriptional regulator with XRE-family HTH domain|nr:helix-turn-helix domain-containing protein [Oscillospiraceae bacterium]
MKIRINERLRELRIKSGYTQNQIAKILNIDRSTYSYYELGKTTPDVSALIILAKVFNISINELLADESGPSSVADSNIKSSYVRGKKNSSHIYELSPLEKELVGLFRACSEDEKAKWLSALKSCVTTKRAKRSTQSSKNP